MRQTEPNSQFFFFADFHCFLQIFSLKRDKLNETNRGEFAVFFRRFSLLFADFFAEFLGITALRRRGFSQKISRISADFRRSPFVPFLSRGVHLDHSARVLRHVGKDDPNALLGPH